MLKKELSEFPIMSCLNDNELGFVIDHSKEIALKKSQFLYQSDEVSDSIFFLIEGVVKITSKTFDGREVIKTILHPNAILGELSLTEEGTRKNNASVLSQRVKILEVKSSIIKKMMEHNTSLACCIINFLGNKLRYVEERLESLALNDARERIVDFLKSNAMLSGQNMGLETLIKHEFTQQDIADFTATSRQTVTTVLNDLRKSNKIHFKRKSILIRDVVNLD